MQHIKIRICRPKVTNKIIQCCVVGLGRMTSLWAQGQRGFDGVADSGCRRLGEDDGTKGMGMARVIGVTGSWIAWGAQRHGLGRMTLLRAREWHHGLGDEACMVDGVTGSGTLALWASGRTRQWRGGSGEDLTMARAPGMSTTAWAPGKISTQNFGSLTAWVKANRDKGLETLLNGWFIGEP
jgi:hypothetical protein